MIHGYKTCGSHCCNLNDVDFDLGGHRALISGYRDVWGVFSTTKHYQGVLKEFLGDSMLSINDLSDSSHFVTDQTHFASGHSPQSCHFGRDWGIKIVPWNKKVHNAILLPKKIRKFKYEM